MVCLILSAVCKNQALREVVLDFSENSFEVNSCASIISNATNLHTLRLRSTNFKKPDLELILKALVVNSSLKHIDISGNLAAGKNTDLLPLVADIMTTHTSLETLICSGDEKNFIGKDFEKLHYAIPNTKVVTLDISGNYMVLYFLELLV